MDIKQELNKASAQRQSVVTEIQQLDEKRQELLQEALRLDGEVRALERLTKEDKE